MVSFKTRIAGVLLCAGPLMLSPPHAHAQNVVPQHARLELIADSNSALSNTILAGILFHLDPGWHIYWQNPGDSGEPPKIEWRLPSGFRAGAIRWPQPVRLGHGSVIDYGYEGQVLLMVPIELPAGIAPPRASNPIPIAATVKYLICADICIPGKADLTLSFQLSNLNAPQRAESSQWHALFQQAEAQLPRKAPTNWKISATSAKDNFTLSMRAGKNTPGATIHDAAFFPLQPGQIENSAKQQFTSTASGFRLVLHKSDQLTQTPTNLRGLLILAPGQAFEIVAPVHP